jgi:hypothetical protein
MPAVEGNTHDKKQSIYSILKILKTFVVYGFALAGFGIICAWLIFKLGLTKDEGSTDKNNRYLTRVSSLSKTILSDTAYYNQPSEWINDYYRILCIATYYPYNAQLIFNAMQQTQNPMVVRQMILANELYIMQNEAIRAKYQAMTQKGKSFKQKMKMTEKNVIPWMNTEEWDALKQAIVKDKKSIDNAATDAGIEPRLIVATLIGEQIRLYHTKRELFKSYLGPVKVLVTETQFSLGITGIKAHTAARIERFIKDSTSDFYISERFEHILDYPDDYVDTTVRILRLTNERNHYYSYLYTGLILHGIQKQWEKAGYDISNNVGVLITLFNLGFSQSEPKPNPEIGGANIAINDKVYTFGGIAFDFYYSGELLNEFPYYRQKFID